MKRKYLLLLLFFPPAISFSQDSTAYKFGIAENKVIYSGSTIKIFAGQKISISADNKTGKLGSLKLIDSGRTQIINMNLISRVLQQNGEKNISIDFNIIQQDDGKSHSFLIVNNPYKEALTYKAKIYSRRDNSYIETSIWDVSPGISGIEHWPYPIADIILYDFSLKK